MDNQGEIRRGRGRPRGASGISAELESDLQQINDWLLDRNGRLEGKLQYLHTESLDRCVKRLYIRASKRYLCQVCSENENSMSASAFNRHCATDLHKRRQKMEILCTISWSALIITAIHHPDNYIPEPTAEAIQAAADFLAEAQMAPHYPPISIERVDDVPADVLGTPLRSFYLHTDSKNRGASRATLITCGVPGGVTCYVLQF